MTGGYVETRRSRVGAQSEISRLTAEVAALDKQQGELAVALANVDQHVTTLLGKLQLHI